MLTSGPKSSPDRSEMATVSSVGSIARTYPSPRVVVEDVLEHAYEALRWALEYGRSVDEAVWRARITARQHGLEMPQAYRTDGMQRLCASVFEVYRGLGDKRAVRMMLLADRNPEVA